MLPETGQLMEIPRENRGKVVLPKQRDTFKGPLENWLFTQKQVETTHRRVNCGEVLSPGVVLRLKGVRNGDIGRANSGTVSPSPQRADRLLQQKELMLEGNDQVGI